MSLIYITGISGSGKSAATKELKKRGYEAHDADGEGYNHWFDRKTHKIAKNLSKYGVHSPEFHKTYEWLMIRSKVEVLADRAKDKTIFLSGVTANEERMWHLFSKVIDLVIDEETLKHRIISRKGNDFGKAPHEWEMVLGWHKSLKPREVTIDAAQPLNKVVDEIVRITNS